MRGLVERPDDFHFKFGERTCKIATLKSQFAVDNGGCAGHIVIETELEHQKESRLGFKLTRGTGNGGTRSDVDVQPVTAARRRRRRADFEAGSAASGRCLLAPEFSYVVAIC